MLVAFVVRLLWVLRVQSPHGAVYSDMGGYVARADELLGLTAPGDPRMLAFYPWGAHVLFAAEFAVLGRSSEVGIAIVHAFFGAVPAACVTLITARLDPSRWTAAAAGIVAALWHPQITYAAVFLSELWFTAALLVASWLFLRHLEHKGSSFAAGCALAVAFVVRPQVILTCAIVGLALVLRSLRSLFAGRFALRDARRWIFLLLPLACAIGGSSYRLYTLSGRIGLISENEAIMRLFGSTSVSRVEATWESKDGRTRSAWFSPAMQHPVKEEDIVRFHGYVADPRILGAIREERVRATPISDRLRRMRRNVEHLVLRNYPNPEEDFNRDPRRAFLQRMFRQATLVLLPFAAIGLIVLRRRVEAIVLVANFLTAIITAALYYAEARYRVPYDPFLIIAAVVGFSGTARYLEQAWRARGRVRSRSRDAISS